MLLDSVGLRPIHSYAEAVATYEDIVPLRSGCNKSLRPLGTNRRYTNCLIHKHESGEVALQLYGANVIVWYPDGRVSVSLCNYNTVSTRQFIRGSSPFDTKFMRGVCYLGYKDKWYPFEDGRERLEFTKDFEIINPKAEVVYKLDRKAFANVRQRYSVFREYVNNMGLITSIITDEQIKSVADGEANQRISPIVLPTARQMYYHGPNTPRERATQYLAEISKAQRADNLERMYELFVMLGVSSLRYNSYLHGYALSYWNVENDEPINEVLLKHFDEVLKHIYREEVFTKKEVPIGTKVACSSRKYFVS